jgi:hypothetical protein
MIRTARPAPHVRIQALGLTDQIEVHPSICGGAPVLKGTHIPVAAIVDALTYGKTWYFSLEPIQTHASGD